MKAFAVEYTRAKALRLRISKKGLLAALLGSFFILLVPVSGFSQQRQSPTEVVSVNRAADSGRLRLSVGFADLNHMAAAVTNRTEEPFWVRPGLSAPLVNPPRALFGAALLSKNLFSIRPDLSSPSDSPKGLSESAGFREQLPQAQQAPTPGVPDSDLAVRKLKYGFTQAFLSWSGYATTALGAAFTEAREKDQPQKTTADRAADGLSRYAINSATRATKVVFGDGIYPIIFKQSPCFKPSRLPDVPSRVLYAVLRVFVTENDNGGLAPNFSRLAGDMTAAALANVYEKNTPGFTRIGVGPTFTRFATMIGTDALSLVLKEFTPDIKKLFGR